MNKLQLSSAALVIGAAAMFSMTPALAADDMAADMGTVPMKCVDMTDATKVLMDQDGKVIVTKEACDAAKGSWVEDKAPAVNNNAAPESTPAE